MKLYIIDNWLDQVDWVLPRACWATALIEREFGNMQIGKRENGKPSSLQEGKFINWAHNERYLVMALSEVGEIGVDIEDASIPYDEQLYGWLLHEKEKEKVAQGTTLAEIWTRKEAILKWTGERLIENLHDFNSYAVEAYIVTINLDGLCITICSQQQESLALYQYF